MIAGWVLAAMIVALGSSIATGIYFHAEAPEKPGYPIEGVVEESEGSSAEPEVPIGVMMASAEVAAGEKVFAKCSTCHSIDKGGANGIGPNLWGVLGKPHGGVAGFAYSDALKGISGPWNFDNMNAWLISPRKYAPGTKMTFAGLSKPEDRANVIAYMNSKADAPLPLPAVEAAPAAAEAGDATGNVAAPADNAAAPADAEASAAAGAGS